MSNVHYLKIERSLINWPDCPCCSSPMGLSHIEHLTTKSSKQFYTCETCQSETMLRIDERPGRRP